MGSTVVGATDGAVGQAVGEAMDGAAETAGLAKVFIGPLESLVVLAGLSSLRGVPSF